MPIQNPYRSCPNVKLHSPKPFTCACAQVVGAGRGGRHRLLRRLDGDSQYAAGTQQRPRLRRRQVVLQWSECQMLPFRHSETSCHL